MDSANSLNERGQICRFSRAASITVTTRKCNGQICNGPFCLSSLQEWKPIIKYITVLCVLLLAVLCLHVFLSLWLGKFDILTSWETTSHDLKSLEGQLEQQHLPSNSCQGRL